jgi:hypothetical protein
MRNIQPVTGFLMKPAQITKPLRFEGLVAANLTASGVENDSARRTKGWFLGIVSTTTEESSA